MMGIEIPPFMGEIIGIIVIMLSSKSFLTPRDRKFLPIPLVTVLFVGLLVKVIKYFGFNMDF